MYARKFGTLSRIFFKNVRIQLRNYNRKTQLGQRITTTTTKKKHPTPQFV